MGRLVVIGDIHACPDEFGALMDRLALKPSVDRFISAGDVVDKGPNSLGAIALVREWQRRLPGSHVVMGNHEAKWLRKMKRGERPCGIGDSDAAWMQALPMFVRVPQHNLVVVHGGICPKLYADGLAPLKPMDAQWPQPGRRGDRIERLMYTRYVDASGEFVSEAAETAGHQHWSQAYQGQDGFAVAGHHPSHAVIRGPHALVIDTGLVYGGCLTAAVWTSEDPLGEPEIVQVPAKKVHAEKHHPWYDD